MTVVVGIMASRSHSRWVMLIVIDEIQQFAT